MKKIKLFEPFRDVQEKNAVLSTLKSNFWASGAGINSVKKIETGKHYRPIHTFSYYRKKHNLPNTEYVSERIVTLPIHPNLSENDVSLIIKYVNKFLN